MTFEHKIIVGLEEIKAVVFRCNNCGSTVAIPPAKLDSVPKQCPNDHAWNSNLPPEFAGSPFAAFINSLKKLREPIYDNQAGFKIFLEFNAPEN